MTTFKEYILEESKIPQIDWEHPIRYEGAPTAFPIIAEYKDQPDEKHGYGKFHVKMSLDPVGYGKAEYNQREVSELLRKNPNWNKQLIWINAVLGSEKTPLRYRKYYFHDAILDTPENRIKAEYRYKELIYALHKVANKRPKESVEYIKSIINKPI